MSEWETFQQSYALQPEIRLGLHEIWLSTVGHGPTQADRVLIHSPMLEQAHERRFVVSEMGLDYSNFKKDHAGRIDYVLSTLANHFHRHQTNEADCSYEPDDRCLLGMSTPTTDAHYPEEVSIEQASISLPELSLPEISQSTGPSEWTNGTALQAWPPVIDIDEDVESYTSIEREYYLSHVHHDRHSFKSNTSRTKRTVRMRKVPLPCALPELKAKTPFREHDDRQIPQIY